VCDTFVDLGCDLIDPHNFHGEIEHWHSASLAYTNVVSNAHTVRRNKRRISRSTADHFLLSLQVRGRGSVLQDGRSTVLRPGDFALYDVTRPYNLMFDDEFAQLVMQIPRKEVSARLFDAENLTAVGISGQGPTGINSDRSNRGSIGIARHAKSRTGTILRS